ncbi:hypothetical protein ACKKBG_A29080 [Auxenochlorella protothecoides x Auxenochlorella symbiontica]
MIQEAIGNVQVHLGISPAVGRSCLVARVPCALKTRKTRVARAPVRHTPSGIGRSFQPCHAHNDDRSDDLLRQAQELKARSEDVASATAQLLRKLEDLPVDQRASVLQALGAHPDTQQEDAGVQAAALPVSEDIRLLLERAKQEFKYAELETREGEQEPFKIGEGVDDYIDRIVRGLPLPAPPETEVARGPENAEDFLRRWQASFDETEHGTKGIKHGGRRGGRGAAPPGSPPLGWKGPFDRVPISEQEPRGHVLAPDLPPQAEADMLLFERCLFVLRRGHMSLQPSAPLQELECRGLLSPSLTYEDPWLQLNGREAVQRLMHQLESAGMELELCKIFGRVTSFGPPRPAQEILVDAFLHIPYPDWYLQYLSFHWAPPAGTEAGPGDAQGPSHAVPEHAYQDPGQDIPMYPRVEVLGRRPRPPRQGSAPSPWLRGGAGPARAPARVVSNPLPQDAEPGACGVCLGPAGARPRFARLACGAPDPAARPDYGGLPLRGITNPGRRGAWGSGGYAPVSAPADAAPRRWPERHETDEVLTREEAEGILRSMLGARFDKTMAQFSREGKRKGAAGRTPERGTRWMTGECLTASVTLRYAVDLAACQVSAITCNWGSVHGALHDAMAAYDIYVRQAGVLWMEDEGAEEEG